MPKAMIAMSGGVDSSVAAHLMGQQGFDCVGATMKLLAGDGGCGGGRTCCSMDDALDAKAVARALGFPHYTLNFTGEFADAVIRRFADAYAAGRTPNPCIDCNRYIKFEGLLRRARALDCDVLATGHYARVEKSPGGRMLLCRAADGQKDQTYFLYTMTQEQLGVTRFPLGDLHKSQVREIAGSLGLPTAQKRDSQDICFVPDGDYAGFLEALRPGLCRPGPFVDEEGAVLGRHQGIARYTVGQRRGVGLPGPEPFYVSAVCAADNTVTVARESRLYHTRLTAGDINLIAVDRLTHPVRVMAKIRSAQAAQPALAEQTSPGELSVVFDTPQRAITPGQAVVLYDGGYVLGGGVIQSAGDAR